ncbi:hypothetical protein H6F96_11345 [Microcoleus sp. FACHB-53]|nr:hypothetical protein [Microcoleus sp. FACHB-53]
MEPFIVQGTIKLAEGIYYLLTDTTEYHPERLSGNMLSLFQNFKSSYDSKNTTHLSRLFSDSYSGSLYKAKTKATFIQLLKQMFDVLPKFAHPSLSINIYQITKDSDSVFGLIVDFKSNVKVAFIPLASIDSGQVYIEARPEGEYRIWRITCIDTINN